jgi:hypothetical protein
MLLVIAIPLAIIMGGIVQYADTRNDIRAVLTDSVIAQRAEMVDFEHQVENNRVVVAVTVRSVDAIEAPAVDDLAAALRARLNRPVTVEVTTLPIIRADG